MRRNMMLGQWLASGILMMLLASGCFQGGSNQLQPTADTFIPTWTPFPSNTPPEPETVIMVVTSTIDPLAVAQDVPDEGVGGADPNALTGEDTLQQVPTEEPVALDPDQERATAIIQGATATQEFILTSTAQALGIGQPFATASPTTGFDTTLPTATTALVAGADCIDEVRAGDNLFRISQRYGLTVGEIAARNGISNINLIYPGDMLTIPGCGTTGYVPLPTSTATPAPTLVGGGTTGGTTTGGTTGDTSGGVFVTFTPIASTGGQCGTHVVVEGETLFQIAQANGSTVSAIAAANGIVNVDLIDMGDSLTIPC